jgi:hypothetical protein
MINPEFNNSGPVIVSQCLPYPQPLPKTVILPSWGGKFFLFWGFAVGVANCKPQREKFPGVWPFMKRLQNKLPAPAPAPILGAGAGAEVSRHRVKRTKLEGQGVGVILRQQM